MNSSKLVLARNALYALFFINGAVLATWVVHIPTVQRKFSLGEGTLGLVFMGLAGGALLMMPLTGLLVVRIGSRRVLTVTTTTLCLSLPFILLAPSALFVAVVLFFLGLSNGAMEVAMNAHAVAVEKALNKPVMSSFHACWSIGGLVGAGAGVLAFAGGLPPLSHTITVAMLLMLLGFSVTSRLLEASFDASEEPVFTLPRGPLVGLGLLAFAGLVAEGAIANWGTIYFRNTLGASTGLAAAGYAVFQGAMVLGRLFGDTLKARWTDAVFARSSALLVTFGLGSTLLINEVVSSLVGFGLIGFGLSNLVPIFFSTAGRVPGIPASVAVATVSTSGYMGYLVGPPLIGLTAEVTQLRIALTLILALILCLVVFAPTVLRQVTYDSEANYWQERA